MGVEKRSFPFLVLHPENPRQVPCQKLDGPELAQAGLWGAAEGAPRGCGAAEAA